MSSMVRIQAVVLNMFLFKDYLILLVIFVVGHRSEECGGDTIMRIEDLLLN